MVERLADNLFFQKSSDGRWAVSLFPRKSRIAPSDDGALQLRRRVGQWHLLVIIVASGLAPHSQHDFSAFLALWVVGFLAITLYLERKTTGWNPVPPECLPLHGMPPSLRWPRW